MGRTSAQQRDGYVIATSDAKRKFVRRNDQKAPFALLGKSLRRVSLVCRVKNKDDSYHALIVDPTPRQLDIQCDRCPKAHRPSNPFCTGNRRGVRSRARDPNVLYSLRTGASLGRVVIVNEFAGPKRTTSSAVISVVDKTQAQLPMQFPAAVVPQDDSPLVLLKK